ncbi:MAG: polyhydroxyalkanoate depolymerase [Pseudomonadota bacterium]
MQYHAYEAAHAMIAPWRIGAKIMKQQARSPFNPFHWTPMARQIAAACDVFESITRRYGKPEWGIDTTKIYGLEVPVEEDTVLAKPFCNLVHFKRDSSVMGRRNDPKVLVVAPMSGHYATLLRGTVQAMLPEHEVYVTDWIDARDVPLFQGSFDFDDFVDYLIEFVTHLGENTHVMAVCQPAVPALAATALMASRGMPNQPASLTLMGGPIDTRRNPTVVNKLAEERPISWFRNNVIARVPFPNAGFMREVYPGFIQLTGFMTMNLQRHTKAHVRLFDNLVQGDKDSVQQHRTFYEEYLAVMDLPAEFYLQTVKTVFQDHALPKGEMRHRGELIDCGAIEKTAILTIEGEKDDICGLGQTEAAQSLCTNVPLDERYHYVQAGVGHYGVFNGTRFRTEIQPRIREMIRSIEFKRKTGNSSAVGLPYRALTEERETEIDWRETDVETAKRAADIATSGEGQEAKPSDSADTAAATPQPTLDPTPPDASVTRH